MAGVRVGTSGWQYRHWIGVLYPRDLPPARWLEVYARAFETVEVNATFYRLPSEATVDGWRARTPARFAFALKGSRFLTHVKRLLDEGPGLARFMGPAARLGPKLGPILWQLRPSQRPDLPRLDRWLARLPPGRHAVEFRDPGWYTEATCAVHGATFCEHDRVARPPPRPTGGWRYLRFHGVTGEYRGRHGAERLLPWARELLAWEAAGREAWVYFNNDLGGEAVRDALALRALLGGPAAAELPSP